MPNQEQKRILDSDQEMLLFTTQQEIISTLDEQISLIEKEIEKIIQEDQELQNQFRLLLSIKGIGGVTAQYLIIQTQGSQLLNPGENLHPIAVLHLFPINPEQAYGEKQKLVV